MTGRERECVRCGAALEGKAYRFCSKSCNDRHRNLARTVPFWCRVCEQTVMVPKKGIEERLHCSLSCARSAYNRTHFAGAANPRWRGGRALSYGPGWKAIKEQIRARDLVCRHCGKTPAENERALDVHHLVPFRFTADNSHDNLIALCRSCHMRADDHGRAGAARFLTEPKPKRPTKRQIRALKARLRAAEATALRKTQQRRARALRDQGQSLREIARALGVSYQSVQNWLSGRHIARECPPAYARQAGCSPARALGILGEPLARKHGRENVGVVVPIRPSLVPIPRSVPVVARFQAQERAAG